MKQFKDFIDEEANPEVASTYKRIAVQHLKDMMSKGASNSSKIHAKKMHQRALEASKMSNHTDALNHYRGMKEEVEQVKEGYGEDDIAVGGTAIYKHDGKHHMSKVSHKTGGGASTKIHTKSGHVVPLHHVVSTDASDWNHFKDKAVKEEVEQVDELNKKTLASYVSKAAGSYGRDKQLIGRTSPDGTVKSADPDLKRAVKNRLTGINRAAERLAKEEVEDVAEGKKPDRYHIVGKDGKPANLASYADKASAIKDRDEKHPGAVVQQVGPRGKVKSVAEEIEQIDELSPELMRRAADKYQDKINRSKHPAETDKLLDKQARMSGQARRNELGKRYKDGGLAARKEEVEHIDEISQATKDSYAKKAKAEVDELKSHVKGEYGGIVKRMIARRKKGLKLAQKKTSE